MRPNFRFGIFTVVIILFSLLGVNLTFAQETGNSAPSNSISQAANLPWTYQYAHIGDNLEDFGAYTSLALRPFDDLPYISYYDAINGDLMLAHYQPNGSGNCGTNNMWHCEVLDGDNGDNVGTYTSIDFWADEATHTWKIGISYHDITNRALKFITWTCTQLTCTLHKIYTIRSSDFNFVSYGLYTSFKFGIDGTPIIAYYLSYNEGDDSLNYASYVETGGNCGEAPDEGEWQCDIIDAGEQTGQYASLDLTFDGTVYIAYYDGEFGNLKLANFWGIIEDDCYDDNGWACPIIDSVGDVGSYASLVMQRFPTDKLYRIAYYNATTDQLKYTDESWDPFIVDDMGSSMGRMGISMNLDGDGFPIIAYQQITSEFSPPTLVIARPYLAYDDGNFGDCGEVPPGYIFLYWRCQTIDNAGQYLEEAEYVSTAIRSTGLPVIAYSEFRSVDAGDNARSVKIIYQYYQSVLPIITKP
jgi:hypothetical protein